MIPETLDECFVELAKVLSLEEIEVMRVGTEDDMSLYHHGLGRWLRNNWGLWAGGNLRDWFDEQGVHHADDMSAIILNSFWRFLNKQPIELETQVKFYQTYWDEMKKSEMLGDFTITVDRDGNIKNANGFVIGHVDPRKNKEMIIATCLKPLDNVQDDRDVLE